ncbi:MAG: DUF2971 domain-containing protein [Prevotella sp.]|nr:DUF2971 domain-containing protein [Prevotella sp.]
MEKINLDHLACNIDVESFWTKFDTICKDHGLAETMRPFICKCQDTNIFFEYVPGSFSFTEEYENQLFETLLGTLKKDEILYKYTSANFINYIMGDDISMLSIVCMNDTTECDYADEYFKRKGLEYVFQKPEVYNIGSNIFITSFTKKCDNLTMWRLYGDECKGVSVGFEVKDLPNGFYLAKVSYAEKDNTHKELDFIKDIRNIVENNNTFYLRNFLVWKHFFKPYDYSDEDEYRLLYFLGSPVANRKWIRTNNGIITPLVSFSACYLNTEKQTYPLQIKELYLGPKMPEKEVNKHMIELMLNNKFGWSNKKDITISISKKNNYR